MDLFLISILIFFLELACIRWFPAHVLFLTFFTNTVLLACFLGMSVGCLAARHRWNFLAWTPLLLAVGMGTAHVVVFLWRRLGLRLDVGGQQTSPQYVFFGTEYDVADPATFLAPVEVVAGFFFVIVALTLVGPGQELGRAFMRLPNRVAAYSINILGSILGIVLFAAFSWLELSPFWWFLAVLLLVYFLFPRPVAGAPLLAGTFYVLSAVLSPRAAVPESAPVAGEPAPTAP
jgi:hypothetical protein